MTKVLITGATGNVGLALIHSLEQMNHSLELYAGIRNSAEDKLKLAQNKVKCLPFDFTDFSTIDAALASCDILFLLRPPQISDVNKYFTPIIECCKAKGVLHIVFLSVQGVEKSNIIPHHKIEKLIIASGIPYTFLRPSYFMQNFSGNLQNDLVNKNRIYLPAGKAKFTLIDVRDIGLAKAKVLTNISEHINKAYDLTSTEKLSFAEMAEKLSHILGKDIRYKSPNLISFFLTKRKEKIPTMLILVMIMLHYLPRFQQEPQLSDWVKKITGKQAISFEQFVKENKALLTNKEN